MLTFSQFLVEFSVADVLAPRKKLNIHKALGLQAPPKPVKKMKPGAKPMIKKKSFGPKQNGLTFKPKPIPSLATMAKRAVKQAFPKTPKATNPKIRRSLNTPSAPLA